MNAVSGTLLALICIAILAAPRRWALLSITVGILFLTQGHALVVGGYTFHVPRILAYIGFIRVISRHEFSFSKINKVDTALLLLYLYVTVVLTFRPDEPIPLRIAKMLDVMCGYFAFRGFVQELDDLKWFLKAFAFTLVPYTLLLAVESATGRNMFEIVGGSTRQWMRGSSVRCFGSFRHPSLLGSVGATFFPLFASLVLSKTAKKIGILGAALCALIVFFSSSGGPLSALVTGMLALPFWLIRTRLRAVRWGIVAGIALLALVMKAPVWYLLARVSAVTGGTGWHRAYLIDVTIRNIDRWWLFGLSLKETHGWFPYNLAATGGADVTNQFIAFGFQGGLLAVGLFVLLIFRAFSSLGHTLQALRSDFDPAAPQEEFLIWGLGVMLVVHVSNWLGITYWDQFQLFWLFHLACISGISSQFLSGGQDGHNEGLTEQHAANATCSDEE